MRIILLGYYGFGNVGDEAGLGVILGRLKRAWPDARVLVVSRRPRETAAGYGVDAIGRTDLPRLWRELRGADLFLLGGGGLLQDVTSLRSLLYYLEMIRLAERAGVPVVLYGQGIGPLRRPISRRLTRAVLSGVGIIAVRDQGSAETVRRFGLEDRLLVGTDPVFGHPLPPAGLGRRLLQEAGAGEGPWLGVALRDVEGRGFLPEAARWVREVAAAEGLTPVFLSFQSPFDDVWHGLLEREIGRSLPALRGLGPAETLAVVGEMSILLGVRLHSLVMAAMTGVPFIGVAYDPKVRAVLEDFGLPLLDPREFRAAEMLPRSRELLARREEIGEGMRRRAAELAAAEERLWEEISRRPKR